MLVKRRSLLSLLLEMHSTFLTASGISVNCSNFFDLMKLQLSHPDSCKTITMKLAYWERWHTSCIFICKIY